ncbi:MAG: hypothetical protein ACI9ON_002845 [Limisphaerales bacterium]
MGIFVTLFPGYALSQRPNQAKLMLNTTTLNLKPVYLAAAVAFTLAALASAPSQAGMSNGKAVTLCKNEVQSRYGKEAQSNVRRIRDGSTIKVKLKVRGVTDSAFTVNCAVSGTNSIALSTVGETPAIATRLDTVKKAT